MDDQATILVLFLISLLTACAGEEKGEDNMLAFAGKYKGNCKKDGIFYKGLTTYVVCTHGIGYVQSCPSGTKNADLSEFTQENGFKIHAFCTVNLNDKGYSVYKHSKSHQKHKKDAKKTKVTPSAIEEKQWPMRPSYRKKGISAGDKMVKKHLVAYIYKTGVAKDKPSVTKSSGYKYYKDPFGGLKQNPARTQKGNNGYTPSYKENSKINMDTHYEYPGKTDPRDLHLNDTNPSSSHPISGPFDTLSSSFSYKKPIQESSSGKLSSGTPFEYTVVYHPESPPDIEYPPETKIAKRQRTKSGQSYPSPKAERNGHTIDKQVTRPPRRQKRYQGEAKKRTSYPKDTEYHSHGYTSAKARPATRSYSTATTAYNQYTPQEYNEDSSPSRSSPEKPLVYGSNVQYRPTKRKQGATYHKDKQYKTRPVKKRTSDSRVHETNIAANQGRYQPDLGKRDQNQYRNTDNLRYNRKRQNGYVPKRQTPPKRRQSAAPPTNKHSLSPIESDILESLPQASYRDYTKRAFATPSGFDDNSYHKVKDAFPDVDSLIMERFRGHMGDKMTMNNGHGNYPSDGPSNYQKNTRELTDSYSNVKRKTNYYPKGTRPVRSNILDGHRIPNSEYKDKNYVNRPIKTGYRANHRVRSKYPKENFHRSSDYQNSFSNSRSHYPNKNTVDRNDNNQNSYQADSYYQNENIPEDTNIHPRVSNPNYLNRNTDSRNTYEGRNEHFYSNYLNRDTRPYSGNNQDRNSVDQKINRIDSRPGNSDFDRPYEQRQGQTAVYHDGSIDDRERRPVPNTNYDHANSGPQVKSPTGASSNNNRHGNANAYRGQRVKSQPSVYARERFNGRASSVGLRPHTLRGNVTSKPIKVNYAVTNEKDNGRQRGMRNGDYRRQSFPQSVDRNGRNSGGRNAEHPDGDIVEPLMVPDNDNGANIEVSPDSSDFEQAVESVVNAAWGINGDSYEKGHGQFSDLSGGHNTDVAAVKPPSKEEGKTKHKHEHGMESQV